MREISTEGNILAELEDGTGDTWLLTRITLTKIIDHCLHEELSESALIDWANTIELTENVIYEAGYEQLIADVLFSLASPEINKKLTLHELESLRQQLSTEQ